MPSISYEDQKQEAAEQIVHEFKNKKAQRIIGLSYWSEIIWQDNEPLKFKKEDAEIKSLL